MSMCIVTVTSNLWSNEEEVVTYALRILTCLTFNDDRYCECIMSSNCIKKIIDYAYIRKPVFYGQCLKIIGNILTTDSYAEVIIVINIVID